MLGVVLAEVKIRREGDCVRQNLDWRTGHGVPFLLAKGRDKAAGKEALLSQANSFHSRRAPFLRQVLRLRQETKQQGAVRKAAASPPSDRPRVRREWLRRPPRLKLSETRPRSGHPGSSGAVPPGVTWFRGSRRPGDRARGRHRQAGDRTLLPGRGDPGLPGAAPGPAGRRAYPRRSPPVPSRAGRGGPRGGAEGCGRLSLSQARASSRAADPVSVTSKGSPPRRPPLHSLRSPVAGYRLLGCKVLGGDLCHSVDTAIRDEGTQRAKKHLASGTGLCGFFQVLKEQVAAVEPGGELWMVSTQDDHRRGKGRYLDHLEMHLESTVFGQAWWLTPIISVFWEAKAGGSRGGTQPDTFRRWSPGGAGCQDGPRCPAGGARVPDQTRLQTRSSSGSHPEPPEPDSR
ncbi:hypothetical protein AAY473_027716 [Plecturocebus cupreus]